MTRRQAAQFVTTLLLAACLLVARPVWAQATPLPPVCDDKDTVAVMDKLIATCPNGQCPFEKNLDDVLSGADLVSLASKVDLEPLHVLFRRNRSAFTPSEVANYATSVRGLERVVAKYRAYPGARIVVLGRASLPGDRRKNIDLSQQRTKSVMDFIHVLGVRNWSDIQHAYFGAAGLQLRLDDIGRLGISESELRYEGDSRAAMVEALNQSVEVFVFPCGAKAQPASEPDGAERCAEPPSTKTAPTASASSSPVTRLPGACESVVAETPVSALFLADGPLDTLFKEWVDAKDETDLERLRVYYYPAGEPELERIDPPELSLGDVASGKTAKSKWLSVLAGKQAGVGPVPSLPSLDVVCGMLPASSGGCATGPARPSASCWIVAAALALMWLRRAARR